MASTPLVMAALNLWCTNFELGAIVWGGFNDKLLQHTFCYCDTSSLSDQYLGSESELQLSPSSGGHTSSGTSHSSRSYDFCHKPGIGAACDRSLYALTRTCLSCLDLQHANLPWLNLSRFRARLRQIAILVVSTLARFSRSRLRDSQRLIDDSVRVIFRSFEVSSIVTDI